MTGYPEWTNTQTAQRSGNTIYTITATLGPGLAFIETHLEITRLRTLYTEINRLESPTLNYTILRLALLRVYRSLRLHVNLHRYTWHALAKGTYVILLLRVRTLCACISASSGTVPRTLFKPSEISHFRLRRFH